MGIKEFSVPAEGGWNLGPCFRDIEDNGLLVREIEVAYRPKTRHLLIKPSGIGKLALSTSFMSEIKEQFEILSAEVIRPLINFTKTDFTLTIRVNPNGRFSFNEFNICLRPNLSNEKQVSRRYKKAITMFSYFAEYLESFTLQGRQHSIRNLFGNAVLGLEDLKEVIEYKSVSPRLKAQWYNFVIEAEAETKKQFNLDVEIPCFEGEVVWQIENKFIRLHHLEIVSEEEVFV